ncbi:GntR family transcriptional regulator [Cupriavidus necator]|uniref:GntR family transcriptional regulator n=1 Tax=Cupriavidus necator TaxID=106590 RepID=UPI0039C03CDB
MASSEPGKLSLLTAGGRQPLYTTLANILTNDIQEGKYRPSSTLPSENELAQRYGVSRQTVRQALRAVREQGLISSHPGIGTIVREPVQRDDVFSAVNSISDLLQFVENTEMHAVSTREVVTDERLARLLNTKPGLLLSEAGFLRKTPGGALPMSYVLIYVPPRYAAAQHRPPVSNTPVYKSIEKMFGVRVSEIQQHTTATILDDELARILQAEPGSAALQMVRFFYDANQGMIQASISYYPHDRYTQTVRYRAASSEL